MARTPPIKSPPSSVTPPEIMGWVAQWRAVIQRLWSDAANSEWGRAGFRVWQIGRAAVRRFIDDDCLMRANSIAYSIVFSIIPFFAVLVRYADVDKDVIRNYLARFMAAYGMSDATEFLLILNEILDRANAIANVGAVIMIVSATNLLSHLEDSFNYIYRATSSRPLFYRFSIFVTSLVVLPGLLLLTGGVLRTLASNLQPPDFLDITRTKEAFWITGSDGLLRQKIGRDVRTLDLKEKVNPTADFRDLVFNVETGKSGHYYEVVGKGGLSVKLERDDLSRIRHIASDGRKIYVLSESGALFFSEDEGSSWDYRLLRFAEAEVRQAFMEDIHVDTSGRLYILATLGVRSLILSGNLREGLALKRLDSVYHKIVEFPVGTTSEEQVGLYLTGNGGFLFSPDQGRYWAHLETKYGRRSLQLNMVQPHPQGGIVLGGAAASLWRLGRQPQIFANLRAHSRHEIRGIEWNDDGSAFVYGSEGLFRYTTNNGDSWHKPQPGLLDEIDFVSHIKLPDGSYVFVGEKATIAELNPAALIANVDEQGYQRFIMEQHNVQRYPWLKSLFLQLVLFLLFFSLVLGVFVVGYQVLPNAPVEWKPALIGGALCSVALVLFIFGFRLWLVTFSSTTVIIYGVWAVIPVGMLLILISTQIVLFGLELAFVIQHPYLYERDPNKKHRDDPRDFVFWNCLLLTTLVYSAMYKERKPLNNERALAHFEGDIPALVDTRERLLAHQIFAYDSSLEEYYPIRPSNQIRVTEIESIALSDVISAPPHARSTAFGKRFSEISRKLQDRLARAGGKTTIADMLTMLARTQR